MKKSAPLSTFENILFVVVHLLLSLALFSICSCSTVNKFFHKNKSVVDSTSKVIETKDSIVKVDSVKVHSSQIENQSGVIFDFGDTKISIPSDSLDTDKGIYINPINPEDYFEISDKGIKTNMPLKKVTIYGKNITNTIDSFAGRSQITESEVKQSDTKVQRKEKDVVQTVHKSRFTWWWLLLIVAAYLVYRYRKGIKAIFIHLMTGL